jgi:hypothetical protein
LRERFEGAFERGDGDLGGATEIIVANRARALATSEVPEAQVDGLFGRAQIGEPGA